MEQFGTPTNTALFARLIVGLAIDFPLRGMCNQIDGMGVINEV